MQDFIVNEKMKLQGLFDLFNKEGSLMVMCEGEDTPLPFGLIDSYTLTRIAPHFDSAGNVTKIDFWIMFKSVGYNNGYQYTHTIKGVGWSQEDTYLLDLTDDRGRRYHIEFITDTIELEYIVAWRKWQHYKSENAEEFALVDVNFSESTFK